MSSSPKPGPGLADTAIRAERRVLAALIAFATLACVLLMALRAWLPVSFAFLLDKGVVDRHSQSTRLVPLGLAVAVASFHVGLFFMPPVSWVATRLGYRAYTMFTLAASSLLLLMESSVSVLSAAAALWPMLCVTRMLMGACQAAFLTATLDMITSQCYFAGISCELVTSSLSILVLFTLGPGTLVLALWDSHAASSENAYTSQGTAIGMSLLCVSVGVLGFWLSNEYTILSRDELSDIECRREELEIQAWTMESRLYENQSSPGALSSMRPVVVIRVLLGSALSLVYGCLMYSLLTWFPLIAWRVLVHSTSSVRAVHLWLIALAALALVLSPICAMLMRWRSKFMTPGGLVVVFLCTRLLSNYVLTRSLWTLLVWVLVASCCLGMYESNMVTAFDVTSDLPISVPSAMGAILQTSLHVGASLGILLPAFTSSLYRLEIVYSFLAVCCLALYAGACLVLFLEGECPSDSESAGLLR
ncbi:hypothetical protein FVE85_6607 [Porphyridium purpureum]|uniref:Uncharacterized protein n=1 Tax=Porphyridium purpureum TaxID=35688 RepID=A0A5J4Z7G1_PORPP|nr:hypothetical protein FVE85_6607 [Porphyridium purpureum]|eukprot:POR7018..scf295_1